MIRITCRLRWGLVLWPMAMAGCATVDPSPDYQRAGELIRQATGEASADPDEDAHLVHRRVEELLADGLTPDEAVAVALLNNPEFRADWMAIGLARADLVQSQLLSNPSLGVALRLPAGGGLANVEASLAQDIADLWQIPIRKQVAEHGLNQAILRLARQASELASETRQAYYQMMAAEATLEINRQNGEIAGQLLESSLARQEAGAGSQLDVNLVESVAIEAELAVEGDQLQAIQARRKLVRLLGMSGDAGPLELIDAFPAYEAALPELEDLLAVASEQRLDLKAASENLAMAAAEIEREYRRIFPSLEVGLALERDARQRQGGRDLPADTARASIANGQLSAPEIQPRSERRRNTDFVIGPSLAMELPLFDQNQAQIARARYTWLQAGYLLEALERDVLLEVRNAADQLRIATRQVSLAENRFLPLAERNLELTREAYRAGKTPVLEVLEAQRFLLAARRRLVAARADQAGAVAELQQAIGVPVERVAELLHAAEPSTVEASTRPAAEEEN